MTPSSLLFLIHWRENPPLKNVVLYRQFFLLRNKKMMQAYHYFWNSWVLEFCIVILLRFLANLKGKYLLWNFWSNSILTVIYNVYESITHSEWFELLALVKIVLLGVNLPLVLVTICTVDLSALGKLENSFVQKDLCAVVGPWADCEPILGPYVLSLILYF